LESPSSIVGAKKNPKVSFGRWSKPEQILFKTLIELYGKNWRKIYDHLNGRRSLAQIRSHAQKYFTKIGPQKIN
jgi:SHAQKYF class myb-like DNA-binding protein